MEGAVTCLVVKPQRSLAGRTREVLETVQNETPPQTITQNGKYMDGLPI